MARQSKASTIPASRVRVRKRRQQIVDAAAEIFYQKGCTRPRRRGTSPTRWGILKGSLYYYVESKEEFLFEVIKEQHQLSLGILERVRSVEGDGRDPKGKLRPKSMIEMMTLILIDGFLARPAVRPALRAAGGSRSARR